jgi:uncharacterized protein YlxW (UPF0749 family)
MKKSLIITLIFVGILLALQVRSFSNVGFLIQRSGPKNILNELRVFQLANQELKTQVLEEGEKLEEISKEMAGQTIKDEVSKLRLLSGEVGVVGEGVEITISMPVDAFWISDIIAQLVSAGAEAIAINGIRITPRTAGLRDIGVGRAAGLLMGRDFFRTPYKIFAIGPSKELQASVAQNGGIIDRIKNNYLNIAVTLSVEDKVEIPALAY